MGFGEKETLKGLDRCGFLFPKFIIFNFITVKTNLGHWAYGPK